MIAKSFKIERLRVGEAARAVAARLAEMAGVSPGGTMTNTAMQWSEVDKADDGPLRITPFEPLRVARLDPAFSRMIGTIPSSALAVPSMMSVPEKRFLYGLASRYYVGKGVIVDAGIFLGASTRCFGEGILENPRRDVIKRAWPKPVVSFERAIVNPGMPPFFKRHKMKFTAEPGESFESEVRRNIEPVADLIDLRVGDIMETAQCDAPVEILFLDILKLPEISVHVIQTFFRKLIPGRSIVIQQDYFYERLPYIKTHQEAFAEYFDFVGEIGSTAVFQCKKEIPEAAIAALSTDLPPVEQARLAGVAMQRSIDPNRRFFMALSKMRLIRKLHGRAAARTYLNFVKGEFPEQVSNAGQLARLSEALRSAELFCGEAPPLDDLD